MCHLPISTSFTLGLSFSTYNPFCSSGRHQAGCKFLKKLDLPGKRVEDIQKEYELLTTTRRRQPERPLNKIDDLRSQKGLPVGAYEDE
jgi:hypothetical protein